MPHILILKDGVRTQRQCFSALGQSFSAGEQADVLQQIAGAVQRGVSHHLRPRQQLAVQQVDGRRVLEVQIVAKTARDVDVLHPVSLMTLYRSIMAARSIIPLQHSPQAGALSMWCGTDSVMYPYRVDGVGHANTLHSIPAPSKAGPEAVEQQVRRSVCQSAASLKVQSALKGAWESALGFCPVSR